MSIKTDIIDTLRSAPCSGLSFRLLHVHIRSAQYHRLSREIEHGRVQIVQSPTALPAGVAAYYRDHSTIMVGPGASVSQNLIVHEATHAICDIQHRSMNFYDSEMVAYVAQVMFKFLQGGIPPLSHAQAVPLAQQSSLRCISSPAAPTCTNAIGDAAGVIALSVMRGQHVSHMDIDRLRTILRTHPRYRAGGFGPRASAAQHHRGIGLKLDGLGDKFLTRDQLSHLNATVLH
jgi:hypothetical protein